MKAIAPVIVLGLLALAGIVGCGPSRSEKADADVDRWTRQAAAYFEMGHLDEAQRAIDRAVAVEGATRRDEALAWAKRIGDERRRIETEQFDRQAADVLKQAAALVEKGESGAAVALAVKSLPLASTTQKELADSLVRRLREATSDAAATRYWESFDLAAVVDAREKDRLPDGWNSKVPGGTSHGEALRRLWDQTLRRTLPAALAAAEAKADRPVDPDSLLPSPTIEEVAADPASWRDKQVRFPGVWIDGTVRTTLRQGRLLTVTSPAGRVYEPDIRDGALVFSTYGDVARRLQSVVAPNQRAQGCLYCKIIRARQSGVAGAASFYRAMVFKLELYTEAQEEDSRP